MKFDELIINCAKEVATGTELKYFWNNNDESIVVKHKNNLIKTLAALYNAEKAISKVETEEGMYQVKEYTLPNVGWLTSIINYSNRHYLNEYAEAQGLAIDVDCLDAGLDILPGRILDPESFKSVLKQVGAYNDTWKNPSFTLTKPVIYLDQVEGYVLADAFTRVNEETKKTETENGFGTLRTSDYVYSATLFSLLNVSTDAFKAYSTLRRIPSDERLVELITTVTNS